MRDDSAKSELDKSIGWQIIWAISQLAALGLAAARIPLSARYSATGELHATVIMLVTQVGLSSLIFPRLLVGWRTAGISIGTAWVFIELAAFLGDFPFRNVARGEAFVTLWIFTLAIWRRALSDERPLLFGTAVVTAISFGGVGVSYLLHEFGSSELAIDWHREGIFGPIMGGISAMRSDFNWISFVSIAILFFVAVSTVLIRNGLARQK